MGVLQLPRRGPSWRVLRWLVGMGSVHVFHRSFAGKLRSEDQGHQQPEQGEAGWLQQRRVEQMAPLLHYRTRAWPWPPERSFPFYPRPSLRQVISKCLDVIINGASAALRSMIMWCVQHLLFMKLLVGDWNSAGWMSRNSLQSGYVWKQLWQESREIQTSQRFY